MPYTTRDSELRAHFSPAGPIINALILGPRNRNLDDPISTSKKKKIRRAWGMVEFADTDSAAAAISKFNDAWYG